MTGLPRRVSHDGWVAYVLRRYMMVSTACPTVAWVVVSATLSGSAPSSTSVLKNVSTYALTRKSLVSASATSLARDGLAKLFGPDQLAIKPVIPDAFASATCWCTSAGSWLSYGPLSG